MKGDTQIIVHLNKLLGHELVANNQYILHAQMFKHWGLMRLNKIEYQESLDEMKHVNQYIERILFLGGIPNLQEFNYPQISEDIKKILHADLNLELQCIQNLRESIAYADSIRDYVSQKLMIEILNDEEKHIDFLKTELNLITSIGMQNYLQSQLKD